ncbi:MAG: hypothetical protein A2Z59_11945 [Nitrospinae bacterium RIFCSPLOWO2_02_39_17]|nr:MAG: hypothetical protein A2W53_08640 [Nitrospinae bacterium RIFCSPHIGHO2_02_39_11]OGW06733.1 MAG: hypothetical protein A2Z59_11945 [Nitrospinae bacterium RIFCSPLOWO2_02_39_17]
MKKKITIEGRNIEIKGAIARHEIVRKVVNTFIEEEYLKKGKGIVFRYPVETLSDGQRLFIARPGHKKNFDFKVDVTKELGLGEGSHLEIADDLRNKNLEHPRKFQVLLNAISEVYHCSESDIDKILMKYRGLVKSFKTGAKVEILLKVLKWMFVMEDIIYWDNEGRAFLFNFLLYSSKETDKTRLNESIGKIKKKPDYLKTVMRRCRLEWVPSRG